MTVSSNEMIEVGGAGSPAPALGPAAEWDRRLNPRLWDTDWLVLKGMRSSIAHFVDQLARPGKVALDFGCGSMPYKPLFTGRGITYLGADMGQGHDVAVQPDGRLEAANGSFDLVVSFQVLEHVRDVGCYLNEARRVLNTGGRLLLSTHGTWLYHPHPEDHRRWTRLGLIDELATYGFEVTDCVPVVGPLAWTTMVRLTCLAVALRRVPVVGHFLAGGAAVLMNLKAVIEERITPAWVTKDNACVYVTVSRVKQDVSP